MRLHLLAVGQRMPDWVAAGFAEYAERMPRELSLRLKVVNAPSGALDPASLRRREAQLLRAALPQAARVVALDEHGDCVSTSDLARRLQQWQQHGQDVVLLIGGASGLDPALRAEAEWVWSLSPLTFPHMLVRVLVAEQLYRAWSVLANHPYHRA